MPALRATTISGLLARSGRRRATRSTTRVRGYHRTTPGYVVTEHRDGVQVAYNVFGTALAFRNDGYSRETAQDRAATELARCHDVLVGVGYTVERRPEPHGYALLVTGGQ